MGAYVCHQAQRYIPLADIDWPAHDQSATTLSRIQFRVAESQYFPLR